MDVIGSIFCGRPVRQNTSKNAPFGAFWLSKPSLQLHFVGVVAL